MGRRIVYSPDSRRDYEEIYLYIAADNPAAAERLLRTFDEKLQLALTAPGMGEPHPELGKGIRTLKAGCYIIFYREVPEGIQVVRVIHGARDIPSIFLFIADSVDHISGHSIRAEGQRSACTHENVRKTRLYQAMESTQTPYDLYFSSPFEGEGEDGGEVGAKLLALWPPPVSTPTLILPLLGGGNRGCNSLASIPQRASNTINRVRYKQ